MNTTNADAGVFDLLIKDESANPHLSGMALAMQADRTIGKVIDELTSDRDYYKSQVNELREALVVLEQQIDYGQTDVALEYVRAVLERTK